MMTQKEEIYSFIFEKKNVALSCICKVFSYVKKSYLNDCLFHLRAENKILSYNSINKKGSVKVYYSPVSKYYGGTK